MAKQKKKGKPRKSGARGTKKKSRAKAPRIPTLSPDDRWEQEFRAAANADDCQQLRDHLVSLGCCSYESSDGPERLLEGTIELVKGLLWSSSDEDEYDAILKMQRYDLSKVAPTAYAWTFEWQGGG